MLNFVTYLLLCKYNRFNICWTSVCLDTNIELNWIESGVTTHTTSVQDEPALVIRVEMLREEAGKLRIIALQFSGSHSDGLLQI